MIGDIHSFSQAETKYFNLFSTFFLQLFKKLLKIKQRLWVGKYIVSFSEIIYFFDSFTLEEDMRSYFYSKLYDMWNFYQTVVIKCCINEK